MAEEYQRDVEQLKEKLKEDDIPYDPIKKMTGRRYNGDGKHRLPPRGE